VAAAREGQLPKAPLYHIERGPALLTIPPSCAVASSGLLWRGWMRVDDAIHRRACVADVLVHILWSLTRCGLTSPQSEAYFKGYATDVTKMVKEYNGYLKTRETTAKQGIAT
jgi:hypothetical protein